MTLTKKDLITITSKKLWKSQKEVAYILEAFFDILTENLAKGETVSWVGFGQFKVKKRVARKGRNPKTGEAILIPDSYSPTFQAGAPLKSAVMKGHS